MSAPRYVASPFWRASWPEGIPVEKFRREWPEAAQVAVAPHPAPEVPARDARPGEWPSQAAGTVRAASSGTHRAWFARGTDIDPKSGTALGVVDAFVLALRRPGECVLVSWRRGDEFLCGGCLTPRKPTVAGLVRVHKGCDGGGQAPIASGERAGWEFSAGALWQGRYPVRVFSGITQVNDYVGGKLCG